MSDEPVTLATVIKRFISRAHTNGRERRFAGQKHLLKCFEKWTQNAPFLTMMTVENDIFHLKLTADEAMDRYYKGQDTSLAMKEIDFYEWIKANPRALRASEHIYDLLSKYRQGARHIRPGDWKDPSTDRVFPDSTGGPGWYRTYPGSEESFSKRLEERLQELRARVKGKRRVRKQPGGSVPGASGRVRDKSRRRKVARAKANRVVQGKRV